MVQPWQSQLGNQRDWVWRGWQVRYTFIRATNLAETAHTPPILFLHGFASALTQWQENLIPLSQSHTIYALDLVGFGASEKAAANYKVGFWVEQVYDFWRMFIGQPIVLVGHSLGALVALTATVTHPEMVQRLGLVTLPAARQELLSGWFLSLAGEMESLFSSPWLIRPLFYVIRQPWTIRAILRGIYINKERVTDALVESFLAPGRDRGAIQALIRLTKARTQNDFSLKTKEMLPQVQVPILLLWGLDDRVIPLTWGRQLPPLNPNLKLVEIPDAGHCPYDECAECVNAEILAWIMATDR
ncbi:MAG: alpha/beta fold hydrolase [Cyanobacteria bacterium CRU_2_1]|nr:alpha/beta fold hydrolase [Cyanobacteria bacterium RU_5_0]NJR59895.1 alpha/beta fold hydrolase [Cyanobacteria bacterium CRU_2_1]